MYIMEEDKRSNHRRYPGRPLGNTKERIFRVALDLFSTKGYTDVGTRDIAAALNVKTPSLYNHYESKEAILDAIYQYFYDHYKIDRTATEF